MMNENTTPMTAEEYDKKIAGTIPYYKEFHDQAISVVKNMEYGKSRWLDLGCGTGTFINKAARAFPNASFVMADPSAEMLERAKNNNPGLEAGYITAGSQAISFDREFHVVTAIQCHHYMQWEERVKATENIYHALRDGGIYITFENVGPESGEIKELELKRWGMYQRTHGKREDEVKAHLDRWGVNYFPITINQHMELMKAAGFQLVQLFWASYMQAGLYGIK